MAPTWRRLPTGASHLRGSPRYVIWRGSKPGIALFINIYMEMTRFDLTRTEKDPEEWTSLAMQRVGQTNLQLHVFGGFAIAATVAVAATPLTGALVAGYVIWTAVEKGRMAARNLEAVKNGAIAHILEGSEFRAYSRQVGTEAIKEELKYAVEEGYELSDDAEEYLEKVMPDRCQVLLPPSATNTVSGQYSPGHEIDIVKQLSENVRNSIIIGVPGSGKGILVSNAIRAIKTKYPGHKIFFIDPKADADEASYWDGVVDRYEPLNCEHLPPTEVTRWIKWCFQEYHEYAKINGKCLLILDEGMIVGQKFVSVDDGFLKEQIVNISSLGDKKGKNIWICSASPYVKPLGLDLNSTSLMLVIAILRETGIIEQWTKAGIKLAKASQEHLTYLLNKSDEIIGEGRGRVVYSGKTGKWYAMPKLENFSNYDRDTDTKLGNTELRDALTKNDRAALRNRTTTEMKTQSDVIVEKLLETNATSLAQFVYEDLKVDGSMVERTCKIILDLLKAEGKTDLLNKFPKIDPQEEIQRWVQELDRRPTPAELKTKWLMLTGKQLNDRGVQMLLESLGYTD